MKIKIVIFLFFIANELNAMQPMQWIRDVAPTVQAELKSEDAAAATQELAELAWVFRGAQLNNEKLIKKTKDLLERGANPNVIATTRIFEELTDYALVLAIPHNPEIVELLLKAGANPNTISKRSAAKEEPVIFDAIRYNSPHIVKLLLQYNANPNFRNYIGQTPLIFSTLINRVPAIAHLLLSYNADPNLFSASGNNALQNAVSNRNIDTITVLLQAGANPHDTVIPLENLPHLSRFYSSAFSTAQKLLNTATTQEQRETYQKILDMFEHPKTIKRIGLEKVP